MLEQRTIFLINADIDDELQADDKEELEAVLESSQEARAMRAELLRLSNLLENLPEQLPPPELSTQILNKLAPSPRVSNFSFSNLFTSFQPATTGLAFAAGLMLTVGYYELSPDRQLSGDTTSMVGTMIANQPAQRSVLKNDMVLKGDGFTGTVSFRENEGVYVLNFDLDSQDKTEIHVGLDHTGLTFGGFAGFTEMPVEAGKVVDSVAISGGTLRVVNQGRQQFAVFLRENSAGQAVDTSSLSIGFAPYGDLFDEGMPQ